MATATTAQPSASSAAIFQRRPSELKAARAGRARRQGRRERVRHGAPGDAPHAPGSERAWAPGRGTGCGPGPASSRSSWCRSPWTSVRRPSGTAPPARRRPRTSCAAADPGRSSRCSRASPRRTGWGRRGRRAPGRRRAHCVRSRCRRPRAARASRCPSGPSASAAEARHGRGVRSWDGRRGRASAGRRAGPRGSRGRRALLAHVGQPVQGFRRRLVGGGVGAGRLGRRTRPGGPERFGARLYGHGRRGLTGVEPVHAAASGKRDGHRGGEGRAAQEAGAGGAGVHGPVELGSVRHGDREVV